MRLFSCYKCLNLFYKFNYYFSSLFYFHKKITTSIHISAFGVLMFDNLTCKFVKKNQLMIKIAIAEDNSLLAKSIEEKIGFFLMN
jgi:hypothetical protein